MESSASSSSHPSAPSNSHTGGWLLTLLAAGFVVCGALWWRMRADTATNLEPPTPVQAALPRTAALVAQKTRSLESYNAAIPEDELLAFLSEHVGREIDLQAFRQLGDHVCFTLLPLVWDAAEAREHDSRYISQRAMADALQHYYPREVLTNADVIFFPTDRQLRTVVAEAPQDHFRDSGWHWRWIGMYVESLPVSSKVGVRELDIYAAEELSEFISVFAVAAIETAARLANEGGEVTAAQLTSQQLADTFETMVRWRSEHDQRAADEPPQPSHGISFNADTKRRLVADLPDPMFREITADVGLDFAHRPKTDLVYRRYELDVPLGIAGGGVSAADFDADGWTDLYFAGDNGGRLFRNVEGRQLVDVTSEAGIEDDAETRAGYFVDFDNDGDDDLYLTCVWESNRLLENDGTGAFRDVTESLGLTSGKYVTHEAVWFDLDNDGLLDLYTGNFGTWPEGAVPTIGRMNTNAGPNRLYHQRLEDGRRVFVEIGEAMGVDDRGWTHCVGAWDYDQDGFVDLFSLNDFGASLVYRNLAGQGFEETSRELRLDATYNAMNFTLLDLQHDGHPSIYVSQIMKLTHRQRYRKPTENTQIVFTPESVENLRALMQNRLYTRNDDGMFDDVHNDLLEPAELGWSWDASAFDYDNDGDLDLLVLNGTENKIPARKRFDSQEYILGRAYLEQHAQQRNVLYASEDGYFYNVSEICPLTFAGNSRGSTFFDFDKDGDLDVAINNYATPARLFENVQQAGNRWIRLRLEGTHSNRNAVGARLAIHFNGQVRYEQVVSGSGFLSQNPHTIHIGLGDADHVDRVVVTWPSGVIQEEANLAVEETHHIVERLPDDS